MLVINTGFEGPDLVDFLEVPEIIQKVLQYVQESKLALIIILKKPKQTTTSPKRFPLIWALLVVITLRAYPFGIICSTSHVEPAVNRQPGFRRKDS